MKIVSVLCWFDESASVLASHVAGVARFADHIVAVDGSFALFPDASPVSPLEQADAIMLAARTSGIGCTIHRPTELFYGNEVEKRNLSLQLAQTVATSADDWLVILDADEVVSDVGLVRDRLEETDCHAATLELWEPAQDMMAAPATAELARNVSMPTVYRQPVRRFYRSLPGLAYEKAHYIVSGMSPNGKVWLNGLPSMHELTPAADLTMALSVEHRSRSRAMSRREAALGYYRLRDELCVERVLPLVMETVDGDLAEVGAR